MLRVLVFGVLTGCWTEAVLPPVVSSGPRPRIDAAETPRMRAFARTDSDGDGIPDLADRCPDDPEDYDGFEDHDGCPDYDVDVDPVIDVDECPGGRLDADTCN